MSPTTDRTAYRALVADVAARAKAILPQAVNGRLEGAVKLVLAHDVEVLADGRIQVGSCTDPLKVYHLVGTTCECKDFTDGKAPEGWCRHRIAAGIDKRVRELLPPAPQAEAPVSQPAPAPLPEAACSVNVHVLIAGRQCQITLRGTDEAEVLTRLEAVLARSPLPQPPAPPTGQSQGQLSPQQHNAAAMHRPVTGVCPVHNVPMQWNEGKDGRKGWHSHKTDEGWCHGK